jgi:hypothetical protein
MGEVGVGIITPIPLSHYISPAFIISSRYLSILSFCDQVLPLHQLKKEHFYNKMESGLYVVYAEI